MASLAISAVGLGKRYARAPRARHQNSLRDALGEGWRGLVAGSRGATDPSAGFWALRDVSFEIACGEAVGIIGLNGAGKSTLLKILSRIVTPTAGHARIAGRLGALLEVGTGFHQELTGRENIFLYGAILGMSRAEVAAKLEAIIAFSEVGDFVDMPVKRYSSGMYMRLAFSVAAHLEPDILLLDEVLAVGDATFQRKCIDFARRLESRGATILLVSHNMFNIKTMCRRVIYIRGGRVAYDGPTEEGLRLYEEDSYLADAAWYRPEAADRTLAVHRVELADETGSARTLFGFGERMRVKAHYATLAPIANPNVLVSIARADDTLCCNFSSAADGVALGTLDGSGTVELVTPPLSLVAGSYTVSIVVRRENFGRVACAQVGGRFHVHHPTFEPHVFGVFHEAGTWRATAGAAGGRAGDDAPGGRAARLAPPSCSPVHAPT